MALSFLSSISYAGTFPETDIEFLQLPPFCSARMREKGTAKEQYWGKKIGRAWVHIHHLCSGLNGINQARLMSPRIPQYRRTLRSALGGIDYVLERTDKNFALYPSMLLNKAEILLLSKQPEGAITLLTQAISIRPTYVSAYLKLSEIYKQQGNKNAAKEILTQGLKQRPQSKVLQKRLKEL